MGEFVMRRVGMPTVSTDTPYYKTGWFEWSVLLLCLGTGWLLWHAVPASAATAMLPAPVSVAADSVLAGASSLFHAPDYKAGSPLFSLILGEIRYMAGVSGQDEVRRIFQTLNLGLYLTAILMFHLLIRGRIRKPYGVIVTALFAMAPVTVAMAAALSPAMLFLALSLVALYFIDKKFSQALFILSGWDIFWCAFWVFAAVLAKQTGLILLAAFALLGLKHLGPKRTLLISGLVLAAVFPFYLFDYFALQGGQTQGMSLIAFKAGGIGSPFNAPGHFLDQLLVNLDQLTRQITRQLLGVFRVSPFLQVFTQQPVQGFQLDFGGISWLGWLLGVLAGLGLIVGFTQFSGILSVYLSLYVLAFVMMPLSTADLLPVLPLFLFSIYRGVTQLCRWLQNLSLPFAPALGPVLTTVILLTSIGNHLAMAQTHGKGDFAAIPPVLSEVIPAPHRLAPEPEPKKADSWFSPQEVFKPILSLFQREPQPERPMTGFTQVRRNSVVHVPTLEEGDPSAGYQKFY